MKKTITILLALVMVLSLAACGGGSATTNTNVGNQPSSASTTEKNTEPLDEYELMAVDAVKFLKKQLVLPESLDVKKLQRIDSMDVVIKVLFSAKNSYGGVIDTSCYFSYNKETREFTTLYQTYIDRSESSAKIGTYQNAQREWAGEESEKDADGTSIYNEEAYFLEASEDAGKTFEIWENNAVEINVERVISNL